VVGNLSWKNSLAYGTLNVKIFYQHEAHTKLSKLGGGGTMSLGQFNFGGGQWVVTIMICNNTKLSKNKQDVCPASLKTLSKIDKLELEKQCSLRHIKRKNILPT
jgi:hypothetical protein